jgi:hypothetical protein
MNEGKDVAMCKHMAAHSFQTRREIGPQFAKKGTEVKDISFKLLKFNRICILANASQTDYFSGTHFLEFVLKV